MLKSLGLGAGVLGVVLGLPFLAACGSGADSGSDGEPVGEARLQLTTVPTGSLCLQVIGTGASAFNVTAALTAGSSSSAISLSRLPLGSTSLSANVFGVACSAIAGVQPTWVADAQSVTFRVGVPANVTLNFRQQNPLVVSANFVGNITDLTMGVGTSGLVMSDGTVRLAGTGGGWSPLASGLTFANPGTLSGVAALAPSKAGYQACARTTSGLLQCWGYNSAGQLGGTVALNAVSPPVTVAGISGIADVATGAQHTCVISGGTVQCLGGNSNGQLGNGTTTNSAVPVSVAPGFKVAAGYAFTCASGALVYCWGENTYGQLGIGSTVQQTSPMTVPLYGVVGISAGFEHACAVRADGTVRCWGYNGDGQLGDGTYTNRLTPTQIPGITDAADVAAGAYHTCIRHTDGTVSCFGEGFNGTLGNGLAEISRPTPAKVPGITGAIKIASGYDNTCVLTDSQQVLCWGSNDSGQLSDGLVNNHYKPAPAIIQ